MTISINIKSGTGGYYDYDGCDMHIKNVSTNNFPIPRIGETIEILEDNDKKRMNAKGEILKEYHDYLVTDVKYRIIPNGNYVEVYVIPIGRSME